MLATLLIACNSEPRPPAARTCVESIARVATFGGAGSRDQYVLWQGCLRSQAGAVCLDDAGLVLAQGRYPAKYARTPSGSALSAGPTLWLRDGGTRRCAPLRCSGGETWLAEDEDVLISSCGQVSFDGCLSWVAADIPREAFLASVSERVGLGVTFAVEGASLFEGFAADLRTGITRRLSLPPRYRRFAVTGGVITAMGDGLTRFGPDGTVLSDRISPGEQIVAACPRGTALVEQSLDGGFCRLAIRDADWNKTWEYGRVFPCLSLGPGSAMCQGDGRLVVELFGVLLEIRPDGPAPLIAPFATNAVLITLWDDQWSLFTDDSQVGRPSRIDRAPDGTWSWKGPANDRLRPSFQDFRFGEQVVTMEEATVNRCLAYRFSDLKTGRTLSATYVLLCIDQGPPRAPLMRQLNAPGGALHFPMGKCAVLAADREGRLELTGCSRADAGFVGGEVLVDPLTPGRWIFHGGWPTPETLLIEEFGARITELPSNARATFDADGGVLMLPNLGADVTPIASFRPYGYLQDEPQGVRFVAFDDAGSRYWPNAIFGAADGMRFVLQFSDRFELVTVQGVDGGTTCDGGVGR